MVEPRIVRIGFLIMTALLALMWFGGCDSTPTAPQRSAGEAATPTDSRGGSSTATPLPESGLPGGALSARLVLAQQLHVRVAAVQVLSLERVDWSDACLDVRSEGTMCAQVITPGYRVVMQVQGQRYEYHTDLSGGRVVLASAPVPDTRAASIIWTEERGSQCEKAYVGPEEIAFGSCQGVLMAGRYGSEERQRDYDALVSAFAPFEAETPAGRVALLGHGNQHAAPAQQRMIAEWARMVAAEAADGRSSASRGLALSWHREGGIAGFCDDLTVYVSGDVYAASCKGMTPRTLAHARLEPNDLEGLYQWVDRLESWELRCTDDAKADAMTIDMVFTGQGAAGPSEADRQAIQEWAAQLFAELGQR